LVRVDTDSNLEIVENKDPAVKGWHGLTGSLRRQIGEQLGLGGLLERNDLELEGLFGRPESPDQAGALLDLLGSQWPEGVDWGDGVFGDRDDGHGGQHRGGTRMKTKGRKNSCTGRPVQI
jgi:hypothetical protein